MARVKHEGQWYSLEPGEPVLEGLLRQGVEVANACRAGACQACLLRAERGEVPPAAQVGLKETLRARGYFLACQCRPEGDLEVAGASELQVAARIVALERLGDGVLRVRLRPEQSLEYRPGQYITLRRADGLARSYSLASQPQEGELELHVRHVAGGAMSGWLHEVAQEGEAVTVQNPTGDCFYVPGRPEQPLLLAGTGTGLAPLWGVLRDALAQGHVGPVWLFHGAREQRGLYLRNELRGLESRYPQFRYRPCVLQGPAPEGGTVGSLEGLLREACPRLAGWRAFLCGHPDLVLSLRKKLFLAGLSLKEIHADAFLPSASPPKGGAGAEAGAPDAAR